MILNAYTIYDTKGLIFAPPFFSVNHGTARRMLRDLANDPNTQIGRHPSDFVLYNLGTYDDQKGMFALLDIREHVADAAALVEPKPADMFQAFAEQQRDLRHSQNGAK